MKFSKLVAVSGLLSTVAFTSVLLVLVVPSSVQGRVQPVTQPPVKRSSSMLCHAKGTRYYKQTTRFVSFKTLKDCLKSGGKMPK